MPSANRRVLAQRLEAEFSDGVDWEATQQRLDEPHRQRLWDNIPVLLEPWLADKAAAYGGLPAAEQGALLDACLETLDNWTQVEALRPEGSGITGQPKQVAEGLDALLLEGVARSKNGATPEQCGGNRPVRDGDSMPLAHEETGAVPAGPTECTLRCAMSNSQADK